MISVGALTSGRNVPSTRFRIRQFIEPLADKGVVVREYRPLIDKYSTPPRGLLGRLWTAAKLTSRLPGLLGARRSHVVWIERDLLAGRFTLERFLPRSSVLDVDDAIWLAGDPGYSERIARRCAGVIAGNSYIAEHYRPIAPAVWIVPTCVDTDRWRPRPRVEGRPWTVGWIGSASNLQYLDAVDEPLTEFLTQHKDAQLLVVADRPPAFHKLPDRCWRYQKWSPEREVDLVSQFDLGLMPLPNTEWARGKCGAKMLLYMASGIPSLVTPLGSNADILERGQVGLGVSGTGDWGSALERLYEDRRYAEECGREGRRIAVEFLSVKANVARLASIFEQVAKG
jgi:glycosyltransferase involved in cell wall biosynthesis